MRSMEVPSGGISLEALGGDISPEAPGNPEAPHDIVFDYSFIAMDNM